MPEPTAAPRFCVALAGVVLDAPDPTGLAEFYSRLLGWTIGDDEPDWVTVQGPHGGTKLSFQREPAYRPPTWPTDTEHQQMMLHLDFDVDDLAAAHAHAVSLGATPATWQPQESVRVYTDPVGHVFCLAQD
jgi:predicted enzyme related to lactoylglutathione lyase